MLRTSDFPTARQAHIDDHRSLHRRYNHVALVDDVDDLQAAIEAGGAVEIVDDITLTENVIATVACDVVLRALPGATITCDGGSLVIQARQIDGLALAAAASRGDTSIALSDANSCAVGHIVALDSDAVVETGWNRGPCDVAEIFSIDRDTLYLSHPLTFDYDPDSHAVALSVYDGAARVSISGLAIVLYSSRALHFSRLGNLRVFDVAITDPSSEKNNDGILLDYCLAPSISGVRLTGVQYGIACSRGSRSVNIENVHVRRSWAGVDFSFASRDGMVTSVRGWNNYATIGTHDAINIRYRDVIAHDYGIANNRSLGGKLMDCEFHSADDGDAPFRVSTIDYPDDVCADEDVLIADTILDFPANTGGIDIRRGRDVVLRNVQANGRLFTIHETIRGSTYQEAVR